MGDGLKEQYLFFCADLNDCTTPKKVRQHNAAMKQLAALFRQAQLEPDKAFLKELLHNEHSCTRLLVAAHCLGLNIYVSEAKKVLQALAKDKGDPELAFEAQATLDTWKSQGYLCF